jgi:Flp pilus assembly protein TadG
MLKVRGQRGQSLLEFALLAPFVLFFLLALVDFGIAIDRRIVLDHAVREGARYASVGGDALEGGSAASAADVQGKTSAHAQSIVEPSDVSVVVENCNASGDIGDNVKVTANYTYNLVSGFDSIFGMSMPGIVMNASATARVEHGLSGSPSVVPCT